MSYSAFPANIWVLIRCSKKVFHTTKAHYHQACPYPLSDPPWLIRNQWSMVNTIFINPIFGFWNGGGHWNVGGANEMDLYNQHPIPCTIYSHAAQKVGKKVFEQLPLSNPSRSVNTIFDTLKLPSTFPTLPASSVWGFSGSSVFPSLVSSASAWMAEDLIWSRCRVKTKESGRSNWAAGGRKSQCSANAWWWWWRCLWLRYYSNSNLFPRQNHSCSRFLRIKIHVAFARLCQMSNVIISIPGQYMQSPNITVGVPKRWFHTTKAH